MKKKLKKGLFAVMALVVASGAMMPSGVLAVSEDTVAADQELQAAEPVSLDGGDDIAQATIEELEETGGAVMFADESGTAAGAENVELSYTKILRHESWFTRIFTVEYEGKTRVAYCIEPKEYPPEKGEQPAIAYDNELMKKALYYSYGYPGYETVTKPYLEKRSKASCYSGNDGAYVLSHIMLSYLYDNESSKSDAFKGIGSGTGKLIRDMVKELKTTWPAVPDDASLELNVSVCEAEWSSERQQQETPVMKLIGHKDNMIAVHIPEDTVMTKLSGEDLDEYEGGTVEVHGGDEFFFTADASKTGVYESGLMQGSLQTFQPYMIQVSGKQDIMYCGDGETDAVSFKIIWKNIGKFRLKKISAAPEITEGNAEYSLKDAVYGIYDEDGNLTGEIMTDEAGLAEILLPYGTYRLQELKAPAGYLLDLESYEIRITDDEADFEHEEEIIPEEPLTPDDTPQTGDQLPLGLLIAMIAGSIAVMVMLIVVLGPRVSSGRTE